MDIRDNVTKGTFYNLDRMNVWAFWLICILLLPQTSAYRLKNYYGPAFGLSADSPRFYSNLDQFEELQPVEMPSRAVGRDTRRLYVLKIEELRRLMPNCEEEINAYERASRELDALITKRQLLSHKIAQSHQAQGGGGEATEPEERGKLKESAVKLRKEIYFKHKELDRIKKRLNIIYLSLPFDKLHNIPTDYPITLNLYSHSAHLMNAEMDEDKLLSKNIIRKNNPNIRDNKGFLTHDEILEKFRLPWQKDVSRMLRTLGGELTLLENALINYLLWANINIFGFTPISVPYLSYESVFYGTGHLPKFQENLFSIHQKDRPSALYLIPTGEVQLLGMLSRQTLTSDQLPIKLMAYTQCFRNEKVGYGTESKGLIRQYQFGKIELLVLTDKKSSSYWHSLLISQVEFLIRSLSLSYTTELLPVHDTPISSAATVDVKAFFPAKNEYIELSSISNTLNYQSSRLGLNISGQKGGCHILNASGLAIGRLLACILESYQCTTEDGVFRIKIPKPLRPYMKYRKYITPPLNNKTQHVV